MNTLPRKIDTIIDGIQAAHERTIASARTSLTHAAECGNLLIEAKEQVPHGEWALWLERHFPAEARTAQRYMAIAHGWDELESKTTSVSDLTVAGAVKLLSKPKPKATAVDAEPDQSPPPWDGPQELGAEPASNDSESEDNASDDGGLTDGAEPPERDPQPRPSTTVHTPAPAGDEGEPVERDYEAERKNRAITLLDELATVLDAMGLASETADHIGAIHDALTE